MSDLVEVDGGFPVVVSEEVEVSHTDFTKVTGLMVSILVVFIYLEETRDCSKADCSLSIRNIEV